MLSGNMLIYLKDYGLVLLPFIGAMGALIGYAVRKGQERRKENAQRSAAKRRFYSTLRNIVTHYRYVSREIDQMGSQEATRMIMMLSKFKVSDQHIFKFSDNDWQYFSDSQSVEALQLSMFIRNNDIHINFII